MAGNLTAALDVAFSRLGAPGNALRPGDLSDGSRRALAERQQELAAALAPAQSDRIRIILTTLADMPAQAETDPNKARFSIERDVADLGGIPEWALAAAARAFRKGEAGDGKWRPTAGQIVRLARMKCDGARVEAHRIARVLEAKVEDGARAERERIRGLSAETVRGIAADVAAYIDRQQALADGKDPPPPPKTVDDLHTDIRANPPTFSPFLRASLGLNRKDDAA